jgi:hypothetical protein
LLELGENSAFLQSKLVSIAPCFTKLFEHRTGALLLTCYVNDLRASAVPLSPLTAVIAGHAQARRSNPIRQAGDCFAVTTLATTATLRPGNKKARRDAGL